MYTFTVHVQNKYIQIQVLIQRKYKNCAVVKVSKVKYTHSAENDPCECCFILLLKQLYTPIT